MTEIEAKFSVPDDTLFSKYSQCDRIGEFFLGGVVINYVVDNYLDTIDDDIWNAGYKMRVRDSEGHNYITIKSAISTHSRFSIRGEIEFELHCDPDNIHQWNNQHAVDLIDPIVKGKPLSVKVELKQRRSLRNVFLDGCCIGLLSLDEVVVYYDDKELDDFRVLEVEICSADQLFALDKMSSYLVSDGLLIQDVAKINRAMKAVDKFRQGINKNVA